MCGEECLNRLSMFECGPWNCRAAGCTNRVMQRSNRLKKYLQVFETERTGMGVRCSVQIPKDTFVVEYVGEYISKEKYEEVNGNRLDTYFFQTVPGYGIDARRYGNVSRFVNHSCEDPNLNAQRWVINGIVRIGLFSRRSIKRAEELVFSYGAPVLQCKCKSCFEKNLTKSDKNGNIQ